MQRPEDVYGTQFFRRILMYAGFTLPPVIARKPHRVSIYVLFYTNHSHKIQDLTGQVTKGYQVGFGGLTDVYKGEWTNPSTGRSSVVSENA